MNDQFAITDNIPQNAKANLNLRVKEDTLLPGTSILEAQVSIFAHHEWKIKEINFTLNRREFNEFYYYIRSRKNGTYRNMAGSNQNYVIWKDTKPGRSIFNELIIEFKYPIPLNNNTPASFTHLNPQHEFKAFLDYFVKVQVVSGDTEQSLSMSLPIRMLSCSILKPGLSDSKSFELAYCGCMSDGNVEERLSIADPNLSFSKLNISADYSINNKSQLNISSISFTLIDAVHVIGIRDNDGCCNGGDIPNIEENILANKTIVGIPKGGNTQGKIDLAIPPEWLHSKDFGNSNGLSIKRVYALRMTPVFQNSSRVDSRITCLLNVAQVIQGMSKNNEPNLNNSHLNSEASFLNPFNQVSSFYLNPTAIPGTIPGQNNSPSFK